MKTIIYFLSSLILIGCSTIPQGTAPSSSPLIDINGKEIKYEVIGEASENAGHFSLFGFIPFGRTDIDEAINNAIQKKGGDNLINLCYNVDHVIYFIFGTNTSISIKGDVIRYIDSNQTPTINIPKHLESEISSKLPISHVLGANIISNGLGFNYSAIFPFGNIVYGRLTIGYRSYKEEIEETYYYGEYDYTYSNTTSYQFIPLTFSAGLNTENILETNIQVNGFVDFGLGYYPDVENEGWLNFGWNFNVGADYRIIHNLALGIFYNYNKLFVAEDVWYKNDNISFDELGLTLRFIP